MKKRIKEFTARLPAPVGEIWDIFYGLVIGYAGILLIASVFLVTVNLTTNAQSIRGIQSQVIQPSLADYRLEELYRRVSAIEALNIDKRLAVIEELLKSVNSQTVWGPMSMGGVALLLLREAYASMRSGRRRPDDDDGG